MAQYPAEMDKMIQQIQHREREMLDHFEFFEFIEQCFPWRSPDVQGRRAQLSRMANQS